MLQPGQLARERFVGLHPLRELTRHGGDLPGLAPHLDDQLLARQILRPGHRKICECHTAHPKITG